MTGGTDLLGLLKDHILPNYPEKIINLKKNSKNILKLGIRTQIPYRGRDYSLLGATLT